MFQTTFNTNNTPLKIFIGVSWPYASSDLHLGHIAGQYVACDVFARYHRLKGHDVLMVSGSDCHGAPVITKAEERGVSPEELVKTAHSEMLDTYSKLGFVYENYTKTATENHKEVVQNIFLALNELGFLEVRKTLQYFDEKVQRYLPDRYVKGTCPKCKATNARGDECPECGEFLDPTDLIDPYSTLSDAIPVLKETEHFFLNLNKVQPELSKWITQGDKRWRKWVREFTRGWLKQGLKPRSVTRDLKFGIPVPIDGWENKVIYVWVEAVVGYLSASIEWAKNQGNDSLWEEFWKNPSCHHYYFIAGGNVPFHTIIWPAELLAYSKKYADKTLYERYKLPGETKKAPLNLPYDVPANKMLLYNGKKMSKGDNNVVPVTELLKSYSPDLIRFFAIKYGPENHDREYKWEDVVDSNNNELVANIGNFINRSLTFLYSKFDGVVPDGEIEEEVKEKIDNAFNKVGKYIEKSEFIKAIEEVMELGHFGNKYFNDKQPWLTIKENRIICGNTIFNTTQIVSALQELLRPFTPFSAKKLQEILALENFYDPTEEVIKNGRVSRFVDQWGYNKIPVGHKINAPSILFEKLELPKEVTEVPPEKDVAFFQENSRSTIPIVIKSFGNLKLKAKKPEVEKWLKEKQKEVLKLKENTYEKVFKEYVELHNRYSKEKDIISSAEDVFNAIRKKKLARVNSFVDIYNVISALTGISIGAHDSEKLNGDITFKILQENTPFIGIGEKKQQIINKGEYAYVDNSGVICRLDIKQCNRTKVTEKSKNILVIAQGNSVTKKEEVEKAIALLEEAIEILK